MAFRQLINNINKMDRHIQLKSPLAGSCGRTLLVAATLAGFPEISLTLLAVYGISRGVSSMRKTFYPFQNPPLTGTTDCKQTPVPVVRLT